MFTLNQLNNFVSEINTNKAILSKIYCVETINEFLDVVNVMIEKNLYISTKEEIEIFKTYMFRYFSIFPDRSNWCMGTPSMWNVIAFCNHSDDYDEGDQVFAFCEFIIKVLITLNVPVNNKDMLLDIVTKCWNNFSRTCYNLPDNRYNMPPKLNKLEHNLLDAICFDIIDYFTE